MPDTSEHRLSLVRNRSEDSVEALLNYIADSREKPVYYAYEPPPGTLRQTGQFASQSITIRNGRALLDELSLDKQGFELVNHETSVSDFYDRNEVRRVYYPEIERLLKDADRSGEGGHF